MMPLFGTLIRRRPAPHYAGGADVAFESTTVSLTTSVPRPIERRDDERVMPLLRDAILSDSDGNRQVVKVKNLSAGGLAALVTDMPEVGSVLDIELSTQKIPSTVVWTREGVAGFKFAQNIDLGELLAGRKQRHGFRARPQRLDIACKASVKVRDTYYGVEVHDISLGGMKVEPIEEYCVGRKVIVLIESLAPIKGEVRWYKERRAGIVFDRPLDFDILAEWVGKRLEMASLKASFQS